MIQLMQHWRPQPAAAFYKKEPESSELGKRIVGEGLMLMKELGFEAFTFRKLAERLQTTEASVYRYFENKHHLLLYYMSMYWLWLEYQLTFGLQNLPDTQVRLFKAIDMLSRPEQLHWEFTGLDFTAMQHVVVSEWGKVYYTHDIDAENAAGLFADYQRFCQRLSGLIREAAPGYIYPNSLVSATMNVLFVQRFYALHLPTLTDLQTNDDRITDFVKSLVQGALNPYFES
ncbi:MAG: TetR family transcriptional regulator [Sphingobacteriaceae bacterium]|nr:TetR family transcriptional regulator [Sphingobacteriaceae bacterium]